MLILIVLAAIALFVILSAVISALHFLFWIAVVAFLVFAGLRLVGGVERAGNDDDWLDQPPVGRPDHRASHPR